MVLPGELTVTISTRTSEITMKIAFAYRRSLKYLVKSINQSGTDLSEILTGLVRNFLTGECSEKDAVNVREKEELRKLDGALTQVFVAQGKGETKQESPFEKLFGFEVVTIKISKVVLSEEVQNVRDSADRATQLMEMVAASFGLTVEDLRKRRALGKDDPMKITDQSYAEAYKLALTTAELATLNIHDFSGNAQGARVNVSEGGNNRGQRR